MLSRYEQKIDATESHGLDGYPGEVTDDRVVVLKVKVCLNCGAYIDSKFYEKHEANC